MRRERRSVADVAFATRRLAERGFGQRDARVAASARRRTSTAVVPRLLVVRRARHVEARVEAPRAGRAA
jgi:hypothetical protein